MLKISCKKEMRWQELKINMVVYDQYFYIYILVQKDLIYYCTMWCVVLITYTQKKYDEHWILFRNERLY
jgi:hypothetical protein